MRRARRTREVDQKGSEQFLGEPLVLVEKLDVEEVPRVLAVERGVQLACVHLLE